MATIDNYTMDKLTGTLQNFQNLIFQEIVKTGSIRVRKSEEESQELSRGQMEFDFVAELDLPILAEEDEQDLNN